MRTLPFRMQQRVKAGTITEIPLEGELILDTATPMLVIGDGTGSLRVPLFSDTDIELPGPDSGVIMQSPDGTRWRVTVSNAGALVVTAA